MKIQSIVTFSNKVEVCYKDPKTEEVIYQKYSSDENKKSDQVLFSIYDRIRIHLTTTTEFPLDLKA